MALRKTLASYRGDDGNIVPQQHIDMHPLEEAQIRAFWAIHEAKKDLPSPPSQQQEHDWLIEHDADYVKQKRAEHAAAMASAQPAIAAAENAHEAALKIWHDHIEKAVAKGVDPDTYQGD